eukprot:COSAG02_NODE_6251_length_3699_cov_1.551389_1_plen_139_part_00
MICLCYGFIRALEEPTLKISYRDELWNTHRGAQVWFGSYCEREHFRCFAFAARCTRLNCLCLRTDLPAGTTAAILPLLDCQRTVRDLYDTLKTKHDFIQQVPLYIPCIIRHPSRRPAATCCCYYARTHRRSHSWLVSG